MHIHIGVKQPHGKNPPVPKLPAVPRGEPHAGSPAKAVVDVRKRRARGETLKDESNGKPRSPNGKLAAEKRGVTNDPSVVLYWRIPSPYVINSSTTL